MRVTRFGLVYGTIAVLLTQCTTVLGIERAELDDAGVGGSGGTSGGAGPRCARAAPECPPCLAASCASQTAACLGDSACRRQLDEYTACLGSDCTDEGSLCSESKLYGMEARSVAGCIIDSCSSDCRSGAPLPKCELYCACMQNLCPNEFGGLGGTKEKCLTACSRLTEREAHCRWDHCEYARTSAAHHCPHAVGEGNFCNLPPPSKPCTAGKESGFPCERDSQCCSMSCLGMVCK